MKLYVKIVFLVVCVQLSACDSDQLPIGTQINLSPNQHRVELINAHAGDTPTCVTGDNAVFQDIPLLISVTGNSGVPIGGAKVLIYADYAGNTFSGPSALQLFADKNGNGVVDADSELVSGINSDAYETKTHQYHGSAMVFVRMNVTCPYRGSIKAIAGSNVNQAQFEVFLGDDVIDTAEMENQL